MSWDAGAIVGSLGLDVSGFTHSLLEAVLCLQLLLELQQSRLENATLRERIAAMPAPTPREVDAAELKRRLNFILNRAAMAGDLHRVCRFCNSRHANSGLRSHLRKYHMKDIAAMP